MTVQVVLLSDISFADGGTWSLTCQIVDGEHPGVEPKFRYAVAVDPSDESVPPAVRLSEINISAAQGQPVSLTISDVRALPLTTWEQAARATAMTSVLDKWMPWARELSRGPDGTVEKATAELLASAHDPEAFASDTPAAKRRQRSLLMMASLAIEYVSLLREGRMDPAAEIARRRKMTPATVRSWIHRARQAGVLPASIGRTAGLGRAREESENRRHPRR